jgi:DNA ligase 1
MNTTFKPMLASPADLDAVRYPVFASPKFDGIRCSIVNGRAMSRSLKEIPNRHIYNMLNRHAFEGLDGELIVGDPTSHTCYRDTVSGVMSDDGEPNFTYYVFDLWRLSSPFRDRRFDVPRFATHDCMKVVQHAQLESREQLDTYEAVWVALGYEGIMLNDPNATYKFGRATTKGGQLLKVKRFVDSEAIVIGIEEEMFNGNEAQTNELGRTKRSTAKDGLVGKGTMGALIVRDVKTGVEFNIGTGFTAEDRRSWWVWAETTASMTNPPKQTIKYKSFPIGVKDKPRHPVYLGLRPAGA